MIKKIEIKDIASFDYKGIEIDDLKMVNVIYGSNGTGKSTVSKVLAQVDKFPQCHIDWKDGIPLDVLVYNKEFCEKNYSVLSLLCDYDNLIVVRAFTKLFAIPGVRLGYMLSKNDTIRQKVQRNLPEWNVSVLAQMAGEACIRESEYIKETASYVSRQRRLLSDGLKKLGFKVYKSDADFILFYSKLPLYDILLNKGILIRDCSNYVGLSEGYFRVAVKTYDENVRLLKVIGECIEKN